MSLSKPKVSIIIVSYNVRAFLDLCLDSVFRAISGINAEVFVVDNNSKDGSPELVAQRYPAVRLIANKENSGFAKANNQAVKWATGDYIHFLNPDTVLPEDFYEKTLSFMEVHPDVGSLGPKLIDGKGQYAVDSKKAFPSFWPSVYKLTGISKLLKKSPKFNRYYRSDIPEDQPAQVEILSGCCLLVRKKAMIDAGGSFDEVYFMFCEDVDLCHRIQLAHYKNFYFPEVTVIHYKGESTRKLSVSYMKIFFNAHKIFVQKYYPPKTASIYINGLGFVLALRNLAYVLRHFFSLFKLFIFDILALTLIFIVTKDFWFQSISKLEPPSLSEYFPSLLFFLTCWLTSLFLNGAYDKPFSLFKAGRGMLIGVLFALAGYALFPLNFRFSRGVVLLSGLMGLAFILLLRSFMGFMNWIRLVPRGGLEYKAVFVGDENNYQKTLKIVANRPYYADIIGRLSTEKEDATKEEDLLGNVAYTTMIKKQFRLDEIIFNGGSLPYKEIIRLMMECGKDTYFKIQSSKSLTFVGSNSHKNSAEIYFTNKKYLLDTKNAKRNKRIFDILTTIALVFSFPFIISMIKDKKGFRTNLKDVLFGKKTWVGYPKNINDKALPKLKSAVIPCYEMVEGYEAGDKNKRILSEFYAKTYTPWSDLAFLRKNFTYLGQ